MLPEVLSNGLCSINPQVDRLCMACEILLSADGTPIRSRFFEGVMRSQARLIYDDVAAALDGDPMLCERYADVLPQLHHLHTLFRVLHQARAERGAIDFDTTETKVKFTPDGRIEAIVPTIRNDAHRLIEECMLAANVATARHFERKRMPAIYRVHKGPTVEKLSDLREFLAELALTLGGGDQPTAQDYATLLASVRERPDRHLIQTVLLRSMQQAVYSSENLGHFGLAFPAYTHFTSPIRRYPDLIVHRIIKHILADGTPADLHYSQNELQAAAEHCSGSERRAEEDESSDFWTSSPVSFRPFLNSLMPWPSDLPTSGRRRPNRRRAMIRMTAHSIMPKLPMNERTVGKAVVMGISEARVYPWGIRSDAFLRFFERTIERSNDCAVECVSDRWFGPQTKSAETAPLLPISMHHVGLLLVPRRISRRIPSHSRPFRLACRSGNGRRPVCHDLPRRLSHTAGSS
jgi:hypothetical protein